MNRTNGSAPRSKGKKLPEWIDIRRASEESGYTPDYLRQLMRDRKIIAEKHGTMWWIDPDSLRAYVATVEALGSKKYSPHGIGKATEED